MGQESDLAAGEHAESTASDAAAVVGVRAAPGYLSKGNLAVFYCLECHLQNR